VSGIGLYKRTIPLHRGSERGLGLVRCVDRGNRTTVVPGCASWCGRPTYSHLDSVPISAYCTLLVGNSAEVLAQPRLTGVALLTTPTCGAPNMDRSPPCAAVLGLVLPLHADRGYFGAAVCHLRAHVSASLRADKSVPPLSCLVSLANCEGRALGRPGRKGRDGSSP